ncbi:unnamed protein product [Somion occarium]|uniref:Uncharacterized protein n=1 Tax=Somion occarium TaxID=3059160 RepID=A0ABP1E604_9APHY
MAANDFENGLRKYERNAVCVCCFKLPDPEDEGFHWAITVCNNAEEYSFYLFHATNPTNSAARWEYRCTNYPLRRSQALKSVNEIGFLSQGWTADLLKRELAVIPLDVEASDGVPPNRFSCRIWVQRALQHISRKRIVLFRGSQTFLNVERIMNECSEAAGEAKFSGQLVQRRSGCHTSNTEMRVQTDIALPHGVQFRAL